MDETRVADGDSSAAYNLMLTCPSGLSPSQVSVVFNEAYDRIPHPDPILENSISEIWEARVKQNTSLYNGKKFRYGGHTLHRGVDSNRIDHVCLHLGLTDYRTFVGSNLSTLWEKFLVQSEDDWKQCQHTASPLGNGAVIETSDKKIVVLQRSHNVGEFPGHYVFPGGHPEPREVGIESHQYDKNLDIVERTHKIVSQEMFDSITREVVEEIGVPATSLCTPIFIGLSRRVLNVRPAAFFFIRCSLPSDEIQQLYKSAQDGYESTQLYTVSMIELERMSSKMPGCHQGGFALFKLMVESTRCT